MPDAKAVPPTSETLIYRRGLNDPLEGAKRFLELNVEIGELENHECPDPDCERFESCSTCADIGQLTREQKDIADKWARAWAQKLLRSESTLPHGVWCECGHISGQHGVDFPHVCATGGHDGCENGCNGFTPSKTPKCICGEIEANPCHSVEWCMSGIECAHAFTPQLAPQPESFPWALETMRIINSLTTSITDKAFDPEWFLLRQRLEEFEATKASKP